MIDLQDLVTFGPSETIPGISAVSSARLDLTANRGKSRYGTATFVSDDNKYYSAKVKYCLRNAELELVDCSQLNRSPNNAHCYKVTIVSTLECCRAAASPLAQ